MEAEQPSMGDTPPTPPPPPADEDIAGTNEVPEILVTYEGRVRSDAGNDDDTSGEGTASSGTFNLLSTMVGGGSLSLPLAFCQVGLGFLGPLLLLIFAAFSHLSMTALVDSVTLLNMRKDSESLRIDAGGRENGDGQTNVNSNSVKTKVDYYSYEAVIGAAFGKGLYATMALVAFICFCATVAYAVLLRDLLTPLVDHFVQPPDSERDDDSLPTAAQNIALLIVVFLVTPLCTLKTLTSLQKVGAASMVSVLILGGCITFRSIQCNSRAEVVKFHFFPQSFSALLQALPVIISCFICHYNVPPVYGELKKPVSESFVLNRWLYATTGSASIFYFVMGIAGGLYSNCTSNGTLHGNILLDLPADDPLLLLGRACLGVTLTLAFPMLVIPGRDIALRLKNSSANDDAITATTDRQSSTSENSSWSMRQPLLTDDDTETSVGPPELSAPTHRNIPDETPASTETDSPVETPADDQELDEVVSRETNPSSSNATATSSFWARAVIALVIFWSAAALACCVTNIDIVWDLTGSSISLSLGFLLPPSAYICIARMSCADMELSTQVQNDVQNDALRRMPTMRILAWVEIIFFVPIMLICSCYSVYQTFWLD